MVWKERRTRRRVNQIEKRGGQEWIKKERRRVKTKPRKSEGEG